MYKMHLANKVLLNPKQKRCISDDQELTDLFSYDFSFVKPQDTTKLSAEQFISDKTENDDEVIRKRAKIVSKMKQVQRILEKLFKNICIVLLRIQGLKKAR